MASTQAKSCVALKLVTFCGFEPLIKSQAATKAARDR
jgi:hypothetical protein